MSDYGPDRAELRFRLIFSLCGLAMLIGGLIYRWDQDFGAGAYEAIIIASVFFGGTVIWAIRKLVSRESDD